MRGGKQTNKINNTSNNTSLPSVLLLHTLHYTSTAYCHYTSPLSPPARRFCARLPPLYSVADRRRLLAPPAPSCVLYLGGHAHTHPVLDTCSNPSAHTFSCFFVSVSRCLRMVCVPSSHVGLLPKQRTIRLTLPSASFSLRTTAFGVLRRASVKSTFFAACT